MNGLMDAIRDAARSTCPPTPSSSVAYPPPPVAPIAPSRSAFACLESLWDPRRGVPPLVHDTMPRAQYEQDCELWIRAPLSGRGILHLACLVADSSLHVYADRDLAFHVDTFGLQVDCKDSRDLRDEVILKSPVKMQAIARAAGADLLIDGGSGSGDAVVISEGDGTRACAWLVRDGRTGTWMARIFPDASLTAARRVVQTLAFAQSFAQSFAEAQTGGPSTASFTQLAASCRRSGISPPFHANRESLLCHIRTLVTIDPVPAQTA